MKERFHINIKKDAVLALGLSIGPWLNRFKQALYDHPGQEGTITVPNPDTSQSHSKFHVKALAEKIAVITPGQKIAYVADVGYTRKNVQRIMALVDGADQLFIEASFLEEHKEIAAEKHHLTARQAGEIAAWEGKTIYALSFFTQIPGYGTGIGDEANAAFRRTRKE